MSPAETERNRQAHAETLRRLHKLTLAERLEMLKEHGILTEDGELSPLYREREPAPPPAPLDRHAPG